MAATNLPPSLDEKAPPQPKTTSLTDGTTSATTAVTTAGGGKGQFKRAKWHLGIRSQSRPEDIMYEVFRAMKSLDLEWRVVNPFHVVVRWKSRALEAMDTTDNPGDEVMTSSNNTVAESKSAIFCSPTHLAMRITLQLYQVDQRSFLLDFRSFLDEAEATTPGSGMNSRHQSLSGGNALPPLRNSTTPQLGGAVAAPISPMVLMVNKPQPLSDVDRTVSKPGQRTPSSSSMRHGRTSSLPSAMDKDEDSRPPAMTLLFFEMCASLIGALAR